MAFDELISEGKMQKKPFLTMVICQKGSNYRILPKDIQQGPAPAQNCQPGTVLDRGVRGEERTLSQQRCARLCKLIECHQKRF